MTNINDINRVKETYVVILDNIPDCFPTRQSAESFLMEELKEELEESFRLGYITRDEYNDVKRFYGTKYMKLTDYIASMNEFEAKMALAVWIAEEAQL